MEALIGRIRREGPVPFRAFMDAALYGEEGFYTRGGGAGRSRDFVTSPEIGGLFGAVLARALDEWWTELGAPDPFLVAECGAGPGALAQTILAAKPACGPALRYLLIDRAEPMRAAERRRGLPMTEPSMVLGGLAPASDASAEVGLDDEPATATRQGPLCTSLTELPEIAVHVVLANELLDNLAADLCQRSADGWLEVRVGLGQGTDLLEILVPASPALAAHAERHAPGVEQGARVPVQSAAKQWLRSALACVDGGRVVCIDYARTTAEMSVLPWQQWLRTYRAHGRAGHPLLAPGECDITVDVAVDQVATIRMPTYDRTQAEFLRAHGIEEVAAEAAATWRARAAIGDFAALAARSRAHEADALWDPSGLGGFRVLEWVGKGTSARRAVPAGSGGT